MKNINIDELKTFISEQSPETKYYLGCDSWRHKVRGKWKATYTTVIVVHMDGCHGCKVFGEIVSMDDYTIAGAKNRHERKEKLSKPRMRMMQETYLTAELYMQLADVLEDKEVEIHLDINPDPQHGSSIAVKEAVGYIKGTCNIVPMVKPNSFAASHGADHFRSFTGKKTA